MQLIIKVFQQFNFLVGITVTIIGIWWITVLILAKSTDVYLKI